MRKTLLFATILLYCAAVHGQTLVSGFVKDSKGEPIIGANIFIIKSFDGCTSGTNGEFSFTTKIIGDTTLIVSFVSYESVETKLNLDGKPVNLTLVLKEKITEIDVVTISAGYFEAGDEKKSVILNSLDIATTAGSGADIASVMRTLPGSQNVGNLTGLYVRGGEGRETITVIDGLQVPHPFYSEVPDISQRGRFSPFLFQGTYFSTGGYSAEYGQGMSSALILNSIGLEEQTYTQVSIMNLGVGAGHTQRWQNTSLGIAANYYNMQPYNNIIKSNIDWDKHVVGGDASIVLRYKPTKYGLFRAYVQYDGGGMAFFKPNLDDTLQKNRFEHSNNCLFSTFSYNDQLSSKWNIFMATSFSLNDDNYKINQNKSTLTDYSVQGKIRLKREINVYSSVKIGGEVFHSQNENEYGNYSTSLTDNFYAGFAESDLYLNYKLILRLGIRAEYSGLINSGNFMPRLSMAYKTSKAGQFSLAYGEFFQTPSKQYLYEKDLSDFEKSVHYVVNYQWLTGERSFRIEAFMKNYSNLLTTIPDTNFLGKGYAGGIDVFWRDKKSFKNSDYWISYSYIDSERKYLNYPKWAVPDYVAKHTISFVFKQFIESLSTSFGATYVFSSGRTYYNPNNSDFMSDYTKPYHNFSLSANYLTSFFGSFTVIVLSVDNVLGIENVLGYNYSLDGSKRLAINEMARRSFFFGIFISFGRNNANDL